MKVYVDFDRTLFDCDRFLEDMYTLIEKYHVDRTIFKECQNQCKKKGFNPYTILDLVKEKYEFSDELYKEIDNLMKKSSEYLYTDTIPFLKYLNSLKYQVIILTRGNFNYQREKVFNSHLDSCYNKLMVTMKHKGNLKLDYENSVFIDDNPNEINSIISKNPKLIVRILRDNSKYSDVILEKMIPTVSTLEEIIGLNIL